MNEALFKDGVPLLDDKLRLFASQDGMEAFIKGEDLILNFSKLENLDKILEENGIVSGILDSPEMTEEKIVIAKGREPVHGEDGRIEMVCSPETQELLEEKGITDPRETNSIINVRKGEVVARRLPPSPGVDGEDVFGRKVEAASGNWIPFKLGDGVEISPDGNELLAVHSGKLSVDEEGKISVLDQYTIDGSVDWSTGNVTFWGRLLTIRGSVNPGFSVRVEHDLEIEGDVEDEAYIKADGNLKVHGIIRSNLTKIEVGGDLRCNAIEYATVQVRGDMEVEDYLLDAKCDVGGHVGVTDGKGTIAGGKITLGRSLVAKILGSTAYVQTEIAAGYDPEILKLHETATKEIEELTEKQKQVGDLLLKMALAAKKGGLDKKKGAIRKKLKLAWQSIDVMLKQKRQFIEKLEAQLGQMECSYVSALEAAYPNVTISIAGASFVVKEEMHGVKFHFHSGSIAISRLKQE